MKILFCSIAFPPKNDPESLQTGKYFNALSKYNDLDIQVLTSKNPTLFMPVDGSLRGYTSEDINLKELPIYENKYTNFIFRKFGFPIVDQPDSKYTFYKQWKEAVSKTDKPDVIYSRSYPLSSTLMALKLKQEYQVPWILHLSDPWSWYPLEKRSSVLQKWHNESERLCFSEANRICLTSTKTIEKYCELYPEFTDKFCYFPNVLDANNINSAPSKLGDKLKISYTGGLAGGRTAEPLLKALTELSKKYSQLEDQIEVKFAGPIDRKNQLIFNECTLPFVQHIGPKNFDEARLLQLESNLLVVIDNPVKKTEDAVFFPSKILDYMAAGKRIMAITTSNSCTENVLQDKNADLCYRDDAISIFLALETCLHEFKAKNSAYFENQIPLEEFSAQYNAKRLYEEILILNSTKTK